MPSEKVARILRARGVLPEQVEAMSEEEAWKIVYSKATHKKEKHIEVCFTGFTDQEKNELAQSAINSGMHVVTGISKALSFLCTGDNAGPAKLIKAKEQSVIILNREQFQSLLNTGEIPS